MRAAHAAPRVDDMPIRRDSSRNSNKARIGIADQNHVRSTQAFIEGVAARDRRSKDGASRIARRGKGIKDGDFDRAGLQPAYKFERR